MSDPFPFPRNDDYHSRHPKGTLPPGPSGPHNGDEPPGGGMFEQRVTRLEDDMREVKADLKALAKDASDIKISLATISAKLDGKIDYKWMTIYILGIVAVILREEILAIFK